MREWHVALGSEEKGPIGEDELLARFRSGELPLHALVWSDPMPDWMPAREVPPFSHLSGIAQPPPMPGAPASFGYAGFWKRFVAFFLDSLITGFVGFVFGFALALIYIATGRDPAGLETPEVNLAFNAFGVIVGWLYYAGFESSRLQATPGKMALGIVVTDMEGRRVSFLRATGRHFGKILSALTLLIGFILAGLTPKKQALHDMIAGCLVVNRR